MTDDDQTSPLPTIDLLRSITSFLGSRETAPRLIGLGEPAHGDETLLALRNDVLAHLVEDGAVTAIALETDAAAARHVDDFVRGRTEDLETALAEGFTHGFGAFPGQRDLLVRLRALNASRPAAARVRCVGFDAAMEQSAEDYASGETAERHLRERTATMAARLGALVEEQGEAGATVVVAHNAHVLRTRSSMRMGQHVVTWDSLGAALSARWGERYLVIATSLGAAPDVGAAPAPDGTLEHLLEHLPENLSAPQDEGERLSFVRCDRISRLLDQARPPLRIREDLTPAMAVAPLDPATITRAADAVIHVPRGHHGGTLTAAQLREAIAALPDVHMQVASREDGAPEAAWGDTFFTVQDPAAHDAARMPFATIVESDYPGSDESSHLHREGVFALNLQAGRQFFEGLLGFSPAAAAEHAARFDPAAIGLLMPHPQYAAQGWVRILNPSRAQRGQILAVAGAAAGRERARRRG